MRDVMKFSGSVAGVYLLALILSAMMSGLFVAENLFFRWSSFAVMMVLLLFLAVMEGGMRGDADTAYAKRMTKFSEDRGAELTQQESERFFKPWKGVAAALIGTLPVIALAMYELITRDTGVPQVVTRVLLWPFMALYSLEGSIPLRSLYLPMALVYPVGVMVGYALGPTTLGRFLGRINVREQKRREARRQRR